MAIYTEELAPNIILENMTAYHLLKDGEHYGIRVYANEGYVIYDTAENEMDFVVDPETGEFVIDPETGDFVMQPVISYFTMVTVPAALFDVDTFTWVAALRSTVPADRIFGDGNHEVT